GEADVMGLVAALPRRREREGRDHLAVARRALVEVDDGEEVRRLAGLVAGPDEEVAFGATVAGAGRVPVAVGGGRPCGERRGAGEDESGEERGESTVAHGDPPLC